jgi:hypothetical protein
MGRPRIISMGPGGLDWADERARASGMALLLFLDLVTGKPSDRHK